MVVDSSVWLEILGNGPLATKCDRAVQQGPIRVPSLVLFEIYKKLKSKLSEEIALEAVASLNSFETLELTREVALLAADLCLEHKLPMADGLVLAHAVHLQDQLLTLDNDFAGIKAAIVLRS